MKKHLPLLIFVIIILGMSCAKPTPEMQVTRLNQKYSNKLKLYQESARTKTAYLDQALSISDELIKLSPEDSNGYMKKAIACIKLRDDKAAIAALESMPPNAKFTPESRLMLGALYQRTGSPEKARPLYASAMSYFTAQQDKGKDTLMNIIFVNAFLINKETALKQAEDLRKKNPEDTVVAQFVEVLRVFDMNNFLDNL